MSLVLVVDDDADIRSLLKVVLGGEGHDVVLAENGSAALALMREEHFDLAIVDVMMPEMDGWTLLRTLRDRPSAQRTRKLMLTAMGAEADWRRGYKLGADRYLTKPFETSELIKVVYELLTAPKSRIEVVRNREADRADLLAQLEATFK